jgi:hypothetical protein
MRHWSALAISGLALGACGSSVLSSGDGGDDGGASDSAVPAGWSVASHGKEGTPDYEQVFPSNRVVRIDLTIDAADWAAMQDDMTSMAGAFGTGTLGGGGGLPGGGGGLPPGFDGGFPGGGGPPPGFDGGLPGGGGPPPGFDGGVPGGGGAGAVSILPRDPAYVPCTVTMDGREWRHVGVRYKGNSSIAQAWSQGVGKLPLRLNFTHFKETSSEVADQRFWGFKDLSLSNATGDDSLIREKLANEVFLAAGVPVGRSAFVRVYVDFGQGSKYFGLYTANELPEDQYLEKAFGTDEGNLYKPTSTLAVFTQAEFVKKTNEEAADYSDVQALVAALNGDRSDAAAWRARLDATIDTAGFLKWLAVNTLIENWDVYGMMAHNYYLYAPPNQTRLTWIHWDSSLALQGGRGGGFSQAEITAGWPLIRFLMDDPVYRAQYDAAVQAALPVFTPEVMQPKVEAAHALVAPYVVGPEGEQSGYTFRDETAFGSSVSTIMAHVRARQAAAPVPGP